MSLFVLSDTHLSLLKDKPMDIFGDRWIDHTRKIEKAWRAVVSDKDTVVIAGDVSWGISLEEAKADLLFIDSLPGEKIISKGNHDYWWNTASKINAFFAENGISTVKILHNNAYRVGNVTVCGTRGWFYDLKNAPDDADSAKLIAREAGRLELSIKEGLKISDGGRILVFMHFPPVYNGFVCSELLSVLKKYGVKDVYFGHIHGVYSIPGSYGYEGIKFTITSADYLNFYPLLVEKG